MRSRSIDGEAPASGAGSIGAAVPVSGPRQDRVPEEPDRRGDRGSVAWSRVGQAPRWDEAALARAVPGGTVRIPVDDRDAREVVLPNGGSIRFQVRPDSLHYAAATAKVDIDHPGTGRIATVTFAAGRIPVGVVTHEVVHALELTGMLPATTVQALRRLAARTGITAEVLADYRDAPGYRLPDGRVDGDRIHREAIARLIESVADGRVLRGVDLGRMVAAPWYQRVRQWFQDVGAAVGFGEQSGERAVRRVLRGDFAGMERGASGRDEGMFRVAYHGTGNTAPYERFDYAKVGAAGGEGAQAYGWGLYFADKKEAAEWYRHKLADRFSMDPARWGVIEAPRMSAAECQELETLRSELHRSHSLSEDKAQRFSHLWGKKQEWENAVERARPVGRLYEVSIPDDDELLAWDDWMEDQPAGVRAKLDAAFSTGTEYTTSQSSMLAGEWMAIQWSRYGKQAVSDRLRQAGIPGLRYLDGASRSAGDGSHNYVIFDDDRIQITSHFRVAYHGTGNTAPYERFDYARVGAAGGEGAQAYGWGLYFAGEQAVAEYYRNALSRRSGTVLLDGRPIEERPDGTIEERAASWWGLAQGDVGMALALAGGEESEDGQWLRREWQRLRYESGGRLYEVQIPDDHEFLDWDAALSDATLSSLRAGLPDSLLDLVPADRAEVVELPPGAGWSVRVAGRSNAIYGTQETAEWAARAAVQRPSGEQFYRALADRLGSDRAASDALCAAGIPGLRYLDGASRSAGDGSRNYVVFDDDRIQITSHFRVAYHGTGNTAPYERFDYAKVGAAGGEGAQSYGWGLYFAGEQAVAEHYRKELSQGRLSLNGSATAVQEWARRWELPSGGVVYGVLEAMRSAASQEDLERVLATYRGLYVIGGQFRYGNDPEFVASLQRMLSEVEGVMTAPGGSLYQVEIPDDHEYLDWDRPFLLNAMRVRDGVRSAFIGEAIKGVPADAPPAVRDMNRSIAERLVDRMLDRYAGHSGETIYGLLADRAGGFRAASDALRAAGIPGMRYLDGSSRSGGDGTHNYVVFDDAKVAILDRQ